MSQLQVTGEAKIRDIQGPVVANSGVITALDGAANQYVRGDGTLAIFPTSSGGGSSVSYYLNGSVNQGTFGGSTYYQMSRNAIVGTGTNFSTSSDGLIAQFITDANDPDVVSIPSGNWNVEFFMNVSASSGALASFYVEIYKYNGSTFTLLATNVATPEQLTNTTTVDAYFTSVAMPLSAMAVTDRLAVRVFANVASKTVTLYTEDNRLCQIVTTFSNGLTSLNNLTDQSQYLTTGTSGTDFNIASSGDTHTFNLPIASATNTGKLSSTDWSTFNNKLSTAAAAATYVPYTGANASVDLGGNSLYFNNGQAIFGRNFTGTTAYALIGVNPSNKVSIDTSALGAVFGGDVTGISYTANGSGSQGGTIALKQNGLMSAGTGYTTLGSLSAGQLVIYFGDSNLYAATFLNTSLTDSRSYTLPNISGTFALLEGTQTFTGVKSFDTGVLIKNGVSPTATGYTGIGAGTSGITVSLGAGGGGSLIFQSTSYNYTFPAASGTVALTSDLSAYVTLGTSQTITGAKTFTQNLALDGNGSNAGTLLLKSNSALPTAIGYTGINSTNNSIYLTTFVSNPKTAALDLSGLSDNIIRTFTFPNASGTLALTSNLSAYLPLTGGTLTGALSGTSATFSGNVNVLNSASDADLKVETTLANAGARLRLKTSTTEWYIYTNQTSSTLRFFNGDDRFVLTNTGAATFSSTGSFTGDSAQVLTLHKTSGGGSQLVMTTTFGNSYGISPFVAGVSNGGFSITDITNNVQRFVITDSTGVIQIANLAGTGSRAVLADASGNLSAPVSDISVKQNITTIGYGLNEILKMNPVWFDFINEYKNYGEGRQNGNIAQEMQEIIPEAVFVTPSTGKMGINYEQMHAVYIKAIQELKAEIEELKLKIK